MMGKKSYFSILYGLLLLIGIGLTRVHSDLLYHCLAEFFSVAVACGIFMFAWNSRRFADSPYLLFIGIACLFVGFLDLIHTLACPGMGVFPGHSTNLPAQLWIASRYLQSGSFLIAPIFLDRRLKVGLAFSAYAVTAGLILCAIFYWKVFPACFVEGAGPTTFSKVSEYAICLLLVASVSVLHRKRQLLDPGVFRLLVASVIITIASELSFTLYADSYGLANMVGHLLRILSFYLIYKAVVETGLSGPHEVLFRGMKQGQEALQTAHNGLEKAMDRQTEELAWQGNKLLKETADRRRAEGESHALQEILTHVSRVTTLGELAGALAHEISQPLAAILSNAQAIKRLLDTEPPDLNEVREAIADIVEDDRRASEVIQRIRKLLQKEHIERSAQDVNDIIRSIVSLVDGELQKTGVSVRLELGVDLPAVLGDQTQLLQVILNLVLNGVEAMHDVEPGSRELVFRTSRDGSDRVLVTVRDSGVGIEEEKLAHIFDPFFTTKVGGLGMGLTVCRSIIEAHGGRLWAEQNADGGATFHVLLPVCEGDST